MQRCSLFRSMCIEHVIPVCSVYNGLNEALPVSHKTY